MKQIVQEVQSGKTRVRLLPDPVAKPHHLVVATRASLVSAGTERYVVELAKKSLLGKAKERPDHVRRVLEKLRQEGLLSTVSQVMAKLGEPMPLGYSSSGVVLEAGVGVKRFGPGDRVATVGPHAGVVCVGENLCAPIPDGVTFSDAAYASVGAIALEGVRLARVPLGSKVLVIGLGLVGQMAVALLKAQGCRVLGTDIDAGRLALAKAMGADEVATGAPRDLARAFSDGYGVDAAIVTAATDSNEPIEFAAEACRVRGRIVLVGVAGLTLARQPFFDKELEFTVSCSRGPGRGDPAYEERGIDYPIGHARWTAQRNMQAVLDVIAAGQLPVDRLTSHRFGIDDAAQAYDLITANTEPHCGIVIDYPEPPPRLTRTVRLRVGGVGERAGVSVVGAGNFARAVMLPLLEKQEVTLRGICTAGGLNASDIGDSAGYSYATTESEEVFADDHTHAVIIMTRHDLHAELVLTGLSRGKHVMVEKPLCLTAEELSRIEAAVVDAPGDSPLLMVGFNRRFSPAARALVEAVSGVVPLTVSYRFATAELPPDAWPHDDAIGGGRIVGEVCHAIDTCVALTNSVPVRVYAEAVAAVGGVRTPDDRVAIVIRHENGSVSQIAYQAGACRSGPKERIEIFGGGRTAIVEDFGTVDVWDGRGHRRSRFRRDKGHAAGLDAFLKAVREGGSWPIPWEHIMGTTWASLAAVASLREGRAINRGEGL